MTASCVSGHMVQNKLAVVLLMVTQGTLHAQWKPLGPFGGPVQAVAIDPQNPDTLLAGTAAGLMFVSYSGGDTWTPVPFPAQHRVNLHALLSDPVAPHTYYAAVSSDSLRYAGVFRTRDEGRTWERLPGLKQQVWSLAVSPMDTSLIAAGTEEGLFATNDGGDTW